MSLVYRYKDDWLTIVAAVLFSISIMWISGLVAWGCLVPLFYVLKEQSLKFYLKKGALFGGVSGIVLLYWMPGTLAFYSSGDWAISILLFAASILLAVLYSGLLFILIRLLNRRHRIFALFGIPALWALWEYFHSRMFTGMPWTQMYISNAFLKDLWVIQLSSIGGSVLISYIAVWVNLWFAIIIRRKQFRLLPLPFLLIGSFYLSGFGIFNRYQSKQEQGEKKVKVSILNENTSPDLKWNSANGDKLVANLLHLNEEAALQAPDIILWSESAIPWAYAPDDAFIRELRNTSSRYKTDHILGMNTDYSESSVYNSAYYISADGRKEGRYDKRYLLTMAEAPLSVLSLPFLNTGGFHAEEGDEDQPLKTKAGDAGILICNETFVSRAAYTLVRNGASFFMVLSNDGWFGSSDYLVRQHFYSCRLRAVENRRDICINSNLGLSGMIASSGAIMERSGSTEGRILLTKLSINHHTSFYTRFPNLFVYVFSVILLISTMSYHPKNQPT